MTKTETLLRALLGPIRDDVRPLAAVIDYVAALLFKEGVPMDDVRVTKTVSPAVAEQLGKPVTAVSRSVERLCARCWSDGDPELLRIILGRKVSAPYSPRETVICLAYYVHHGESMHEVLRKSLSI